MSKREIRNISHKLHAPLGGVLGWAFETKITDASGKTYTGIGRDKQESQKRAGDKFRENKPDRKGR